MPLEWLGNLWDVKDREARDNAARLTRRLEGLYPGLAFLPIEGHLLVERRRLEAELLGAASVPFATKHRHLSFALASASFGTTNAKTALAIVSLTCWDPLFGAGHLVTFHSRPLKDPGLSPTEQQVLQVCATELGAPGGMPTSTVDIAAGEPTSFAALFRGPSTFADRISEHQAPSVDVRDRSLRTALDWTYRQFPGILKDVIRRSRETSVNDLGGALGGARRLGL